MQHYLVADKLFRETNQLCRRSHHGEVEAALSELRLEALSERACCAVSTINKTLFEQLRNEILL